MGLNLSSTLPGWTPRTPATFATPVTAETTTWLCGTELPSGGGMLSWVNANRVRVAVAPPAHWLRDRWIDDPGRIQTAFTPPASIVDGTVSAACWTDGPDVFITVAYDTLIDNDRTSHQVIYRSDDPLRPVVSSWSLHSTVRTETFAGGLVLGTSSIAGIPTRMSSGRLVIMFGGTARNLGTIATACVAHSDDGGLTWTVERWGASQDNMTTNGIYLGGMSLGQLSPDPQSGRLFFWTNVTRGAVGGNRVFWTDDGATWDSVRIPLNDIPFFTVAISNGETVYGFRESPGSIFALQGSGTTSADWVIQPQEWRSPDTASQLRRAVTAGSNAYFFTHSQVMYTPGPPQGRTLCPLRIPWPRWTRDANLPLSRRALELEHENHLAIQRWWDRARSGTTSALIVPHPRWAIDAGLPGGEMEHQNYQTLERWASAWNKGLTVRLHIPYPYWASGPPDIPTSWARREDENYRAMERAANGNCS